MVIGFDFDGTLVESRTRTPLPGVRERLTELPEGAKTFIATNQAGPVWRAMTGETKYPTCEDVATRIIAGLAALGWRPDAIFIATHPGQEPAYAWRVAAQQTASGLWTLIEHAAPFFVSSLSSDRKPNPGMLFDAIVHFSCLPHNIRYIGNMPTDYQAAVGAGCRYLDAAVWRERGLEL